VFNLRQESTPAQDAGAKSTGIAFPVCLTGSILLGPVVSVTRMSVSSDGKSMTVLVQNVQDGSTHQFMMRKR
jgi:hypothetical protein